MPSWSVVLVAFFLYSVASAMPAADLPVRAYLSYTSRSQKIDVVISLVRPFIIILFSATVLD